MKFLIGSALALTLFLGNEAEAVSCEGKTFTAKEAAVQLSSLNSYFVRKDYDQVKEKSALLEADLPCMNTPAPPQVFAAAYRYIGVGYYLEGNEEVTKQWFRTALELDPSHRWGVSEVSTSDPLYKVYEEARNEAIVDVVLIDDKKLKPPPDTIIYVDGRVWKQAGLTPDRPHIVFISSKADRHIMERFVVNGTGFPEMLLQDGPSKKQKGDEEATADMFAVTKVKRVRPPAKTPLLASAITTMVAAGGVYGYTFTTNQQFYDATTTNEKKDLRSKNNGLIITSIAIGTLGLGVGYAGVIIDAPGTPMIPWQL